MLVHISEANQLHDILASKRARDIDAMRRRINDVLPKYFTLAGVLRQLPRYLNAAASGDYARYAAATDCRLTALA